MQIIIAAIAVSFIGSFAITFFTCCLLHLFMPGTPSPREVAIHFTAKEWGRILLASLIAYISMFISCIIFMAFGQGDVLTMVKVSLAFAATGLIGLWNFIYFIFLISTNSTHGQADYTAQDLH